jgi:hypothetical protein
MNMTNGIRQLSTALAVASLVAIGASVVSAQEPPQAPVESTPASGNASAAAVMSLTDIEQLLKSKGIRVTEMEVRDRVVAVEGLDGNNREIDLIVDRRSGEILSREFDD